MPIKIEVGNPGLTSGTISARVGTVIMLPTKSLGKVTVVSIQPRYGTFWPAAPSTWSSSCRG